MVVAGVQAVAMVMVSPRNAAPVATRLAVVMIVMLRHAIRDRVGVAVALVHDPLGLLALELAETQTG